MCDLLGVAHLIVFDLVYVHSLSEFVCFAERDYRHFVLTCKIRNHTRTHSADDATIAQYIAGTYENLCRFTDQATDAL